MKTKRIFVITCNIAITLWVDNLHCASKSWTQLLLHTVRMDSSPKSAVTCLIYHFWHFYTFLLLRRARLAMHVVKEVQRKHTHTYKQCENTDAKRLLAKADVLEDLRAHKGEQVVDELKDS